MIFSNSNIEDKVIELRDIFGVLLAVETGTKNGQVADWLSSRFDVVFTAVEQKRKYNYSSRLLAEVNNVSVFIMDSKLFLVTALNCYLNKDNPAMLFLGADKEKALEELDYLTKHDHKPVIVLRDVDSSLMSDFKWIESKVEAIYGVDEYTIDRISVGGNKTSCIFIYPKTCHIQKKKP